MAKFIYKMQSILQIKLKFEEQAKAEYSTALNLLRLEEEKLEGLKRKKEEYEECLRQLISSELNVVDIKSMETGIENVKYAISRQLEEVKKAEKVVEEKRKKLEEAMKERKIHEKLREKAFEEFLIEVEAEEKKEIDELVSYRYSMEEFRKEA